MPLSDHEQRLLEQMERALYAEDPKFATSMRGADLRRRYRRRAIVAAFVFLLGIVVLMTGAVTEVIPLGVGGLRGHARVGLVCRHLLASGPGRGRDRHVRGRHRRTGRRDPQVRPFLDRSSPELHGAHGGTLAAPS